MRIIERALWATLFGLYKVCRRLERVAARISVREDLRVFGVDLTTSRTPIELDLDEYYDDLRAGVAEEFEGIARGALAAEQDVWAAEDDDPKIELVSRACTRCEKACVVWEDEDPREIMCVTCQTPYSDRPLWF